MPTFAVKRLLLILAGVAVTGPAAFGLSTMGREPIWPDYTWQAGITGFYFFDLGEFGLGGEFGAQWPHQDGYHFFGFDGFAVSGSIREGGMEIDTDITTVLASYRYHGHVTRDGRFGLYGGAGIGVSRVRGRLHDRNDGSTGSLSDNTALTWGLAAGVEVGITYGLAARFGYRYMSWERIERRNGPAQSIDDHALEASLNYKF